MTEVEVNGVIYEFPDEMDQEQIKSVLDKKFAMEKVPKTLEQSTENAFGMKPNIDRPGIIPVPGKIDPEGSGVSNLDFTDWTAPQWAYEAAKGVTLPSHVVQGGAYSPEDVSSAALSAFSPFQGPIKQTTKIPKGLTLKQAEAAPDAPALKDAATQAYKAAERSGAILKDDSVLNMLGRLEQKVISEGADPDVTPQAMATLNSIFNRLNNAKDFKELMVIRQMAADVANEVTKPGESRIGSMMVNQIDDYIDNIKPSDLNFGTGSDAMKAAKDLNKARETWGKYRRTEAIDDIFRNAELQASGFENGLRIGFRNLLKNKKKLRGFNKEEIKAMEQVVKGGPVSNTLKRISKLGFGRGQQTNMLGGTAGSAVFGVGAPVAGTIAEKAGESATARAAAIARGKVAGAKPAPVPMATMPARAVLGGQTAGQFENQTPIYGPPGLLFYNKNI